MSQPSSDAFSMKVVKFDPLSAQQVALISMLESAGANEGLVYVATPITTGRTTVEAIVAGNGLSDEERSAVRLANEERVRSVAKKLRHRLRRTIVINPAEFEGGTANWTQENYYDLWSGVIRRFANRVVVVEGWEYCRGARIEVQLALDLGIPIWDEDLFEIPQDTIFSLAWIADEGLRSLAPDGRRTDILGPCLRARALGALGQTRESVEALGVAATETYWWLEEERSYQRAKFGVDFDDQQTAGQEKGIDSPWFIRTGNYVQRAALFGLETQRGRQALAKAAATMAAWVESSVRLHGRLVQPGVASGDGIERQLDARHSEHE